MVAQPSRVESLGLVLPEAWANHKPVIAADIAVSRELVTSSGGGAIVPFGDAARLANKIGALLADSELRTRMGDDGYQKALEYSSDICCARTLAEFEQVGGR